MAEGQNGAPIIYEAFISYRHKEPDMAVAMAIHNQLETYRIPRYIQERSGKKRMGKVFRDQDELPLMADLGEGIRTALEQSGWLIAICSPDYPQSKWCMAEVDYFIRLGRRDRILTVLVEGDPEDSFPEQLRYYMVNGEQVEREPLAADVRAGTTREILKKMRREKLRLLAPMLGVGFDDLRRRQRERFMRTVAGGSAAAAVVMAGATGYVLRQNSLLDEQRRLAQEQRDEALISQSRFLSDLSAQQLANGDTVLATLLALEALPDDLENPERPYTMEAEAALRSTGVQQSRAGFVRSSGVTADFSAYSQYLDADDLLLVEEYNRHIKLYNATTGALVETLRCNGYSYSPERSLLATSKINYANTAMSSYLSVYHIRTGEWVDFYPPVSNCRYELVCGGRYLVTWRDNGAGNTSFVVFFDTDTGEAVYELTEEVIEAMETEPGQERSGVYGAAFSPDGRYFCYTTTIPEKQRLFVMVDLETFTELYTLLQDKPYWFTFSPDGTKLLSITSRGYIPELWDVATGERLYDFGEIYEFEYEGTYQSQFAQKWAFSPDSRYVVLFTADYSGLVFDTLTGQEAYRLAENDFISMNFMGDGTLVYRTDTDYTTLRFLELKTGEESTLSVPDLAVRKPLYADPKQYSPTVLFAKDTLIAYSEGGVYQVWRKEAISDLVKFGQYNNGIAKAFSPDGARVALEVDGGFMVRRSKDGALVAGLIGDNDYRHRSLYWSPDGTRMLATGADGHVCLWDMEAYTNLYHIEAAYTASPFPLHLFVSSGWDRFAIDNPSHIGGVYDLETGAMLYNFDAWRSLGGGAMQLIGTAAFSADGSRLLIGGAADEDTVPRYIAVLDTATGEELDRFDYTPVEGLSMSPDGTMLAFLLSEADGVHAVVIDPDTGELLWREQAHASTSSLGSEIVWSTDSRYFATCEGSQIQTKVWEAATGELAGTFPMESPSFSADSAWIIGGTSNDPVRLPNFIGYTQGPVYDIASGIRVVTLPEHGIFGPVDNQVLMQTGLWAPKSLADVVQDALERVGGRVLTSEERQRFYLE